MTIPIVAFALCVLCAFLVGAICGAEAERDKEGCQFLIASAVIAFLVVLGACLYAWLGAR